MQLRQRYKNDIEVKTMRYEHINRICRCGSKSTYILKGSITNRDILERMDTICDVCLKKKCVWNLTGMSEWSKLTDALYDKRNRGLGC